MGRIKRKDRYKVDTDVTGMETLIGSRQDGSTRQYRAVPELINYFGGGSSWRAGPIIEASTEGTALTTLYSRTIPAGTLEFNGDFLEFEFIFRDMGPPVDTLDLTYTFSFYGGLSGDKVKRAAGKIIRKSSTSISVFYDFVVEPDSVGTPTLTRSSIDFSVLDLSNNDLEYSVSARDSGGKNSHSIYTGYLIKVT